MSTRSLWFAVVAVVGAASATTLVACSDDDPVATPDAGGDTGADVQVSPCGALTLICKEGEPGKACNQVPSTPKCNGTTWECPTGSISASQCGCAADSTRPVGGDCGKDAGPNVDAGEDATTDASSTDASSDGGDSG
ncbi:hypothetical protein BH09MYX1_BH09MYX1_16660 [soil metagenome]